MNRTIMIASPVHQEPKILASFLGSLSRQISFEYNFEFCFVDDNGDKYPESSKLLKQFAETHPTTILAAPLRDSEYKDHNWSNHLILRVADHKNKIIKHFLSRSPNTYTHLFLIDSDLVIYSKLIDHLTTADKQIVAEIFWTIWPGNNFYAPQCWEYDMTKYSIRDTPQDNLKYFQKLQIPGTYQVGMTGACTLLQRSVLEAGVDFSPIPNLTIAGEDRWFCIRAACHNIPIHINTDYPAYHIYTPDLLDGVDKYIEEIENPNYLSNRKKKFDIK